MISPAAAPEPQAKPRILIVDDDPIVAESLAEFLMREGYQTATAGNGEEAIAMLSHNGGAKADGSAGPFGVVVSDINMPRTDGIELLRKIRKANESVVTIVITGFGKIEQAVEAIKLGAFDYLTKPVVDDEMRIAVSKAVRQQMLLVENKNLRSQLAERYGMDNLVGGDYRMQKVYELIEAVAESKATVLIDGESGTGKTMVARAVHTRSPRRTGPFITFACGAIPETLLESELFGHVRGAFTGADSDKPGKCLAANGGTLFIDEINSATPALQLKLLRVLQEKQFEPVGSTKTVAVDVRFILATNQSLTELVSQGKFREDLYYRINVVNLRLPPLRDRLGDVPLLAQHFLDHYRKEVGKERTLSKEALELLQHYHWPGNVRELENAMERAVVLSRNIVITPDDLPESVHMPSASHHSAGTAEAMVNGQWVPTPLEKALEEPEKRILVAALKANDWNRQVTAQQLEINRTTLYKKMKHYGLMDPA